MTAAQRNELDRRLATLNEDRREGITWAVLMATLELRFLVSRLFELSDGESVFLYGLRLNVDQQRGPGGPRYSRSGDRRYILRTLQFADATIQGRYNSRISVKRIHSACEHCSAVHFAGSSYGAKLSTMAQSYPR
jgi:hypothetical protein